MTKILIADDILTNRVILRQTLNVIGDDDYEVIEAVDGEEAIALYKSESPDLILMDIMMPILDGRQATTAIKKIMGNDYVPIIFLTALSAEESLSSALESGGDDYISKPFNIEILKSKIHAHLRIRELTKEINSNNELLKLSNEKLVYEQDLIEHFFESALKQSFIDDTVIKYHMSSLSAFNGDIFLSERGADGSLYVVVGDFTGHGLTAAMGTLPVAMIFFEMVHKGLSIGEISFEVNHQLYKLLPSGMFFTASILNINAYDGVMSIWSGGMPDIYHFDNDGKLSNVIEAQHMPLGILANDEFNSQTEIYNISNLDKVYLYSDGITEARNSDNELFGEERLKDRLINGGDERFNKLINSLTSFTGKDNQKDDITFLELNCIKMPIPTNLDERNIESTLSWDISISISEVDMKTSNPISNLFLILNSLPFVSQSKDVLHVLIFEIYNNALDHSILKLKSVNKSDTEKFSEYYVLRDRKISELDSALISFNFRYLIENSVQYLEISVTDSGSGYQNDISQAVGDDSHGRGLDIIKSFCEKMAFSEDGKVFTALFRL